MIFSRAPLLLVLGLFLGLLTVSVHGTIINTSIKRVFDLTKHVVRMHTDIQFMDKESDTNEYSFQLSKDMSERLSHMTAKCGGGKGVCEVLQAGTTYTVVLKTSVGKGTTGQIKLIAYFTGVLTPYPEEITQKEDQLVVFEDHHVFLSPYVTETQTTKLKLPSGRVESFSDMKPVVHKGASITYGPYTKVQPFNALPTNKSLRVHFKNHSPFLTVTTLVKEIEVSMWGRVSVEEVYDLLHTGAKLKGGFSRFDYAHGAYGASFYELTAHLPRDAVNVYYRDQIGNVSTSRLRHTETRQELEFKPRFPIFGGWKTQWYFGYSVPTHSALSRHGNTFKLEMDFSTPIEEAAVEELTVKVILPEGATNIQVDVPFDIDAQSRTSRQTYLDTPLYGRPVLVIKKTNVIAQHNVPFQVSFEFTSTFMLHEPLVLVGGYFVFFVVCMILFRLDFKSCYDKETTHKKEDGIKMNKSE